MISRKDRDSAIFELWLMRMDALEIKERRREAARVAKKRLRQRAERLAELIGCDPDDSAFQQAIDDVRRFKVHEASEDLARLLSLLEIEVESTEEPTP